MSRRDTTRDATRSVATRVGVEVEVSTSTSTSTSRREVEVTTRVSRRGCCAIAKRSRSDQTQDSRSAVEKVPLSTQTRARSARRLMSLEPQRDAKELM